MAKVVRYGGRIGGGDLVGGNSCRDNGRPLLPRTVTSDVGWWCNQRLWPVIVARDSGRIEWDTVAEYNGIFPQLSKSTVFVPAFWCWNTKTGWQWRRIRGGGRVCSAWKAEMNQCACGRVASWNDFILLAQCRSGRVESFEYYCFCKIVLKDTQTKKKTCGGERKLTTKQLKTTKKKGFDTM